MKKKLDGCDWLPRFSWLNRERLRFLVSRLHVRRQLLLIRLTQHTPTSSVGVCPGCRSRGVCGSSRLSSQPMMLAEITSLGADGRMGSSAHAAVIGRHM